MGNNGAENVVEVTAGTCVHKSYLQSAGKMALSVRRVTVC